MVRKPDPHLQVRQVRGIIRPPAQGLLQPLKLPNGEARGHLAQHDAFCFFLLALDRESSALICCPSLHISHRSRPRLSVTGSSPPQPWTAQSSQSGRPASASLARVLSMRLCGIRSTVPSLAIYSPDSSPSTRPLLISCHFCALIHRLRLSRCRTFAARLVVVSSEVLSPQALPNLFLSCACRPGAAGSRWF